MSALEAHLARLSPALADLVRKVADPEGGGHLDRAGYAFEPSAEDAARLVALTADPAVDWGPKRDERTSAVLVVLWNDPDATLLEVIPRHYAAHGSIGRMALLAAVAAVGTAEAARTFGALIETHGWPPRPYARVFRELGKLIEHGELFLTLYRKALEDPAADVEIDVGNLLLAALTAGKVPNERLPELAPSLAPRLRAVIEAARPHQRAEGVAWRFTPAYEPVRNQAGFLADLAGWIEAPEITDALRAALTLDDPWIVCFAATSLLCHDAPVDDAVLARVASCDETRAILFEQLDGLELLGRFPFAQTTLEAFAAADMVSWLKYPTELGRAPETLENMGRFTVEPGWVAFVWRFPDHKGRLVAGLSGAYELDAPPGPQRGSNTFSRFEPWEKQSAREHALAILKNVSAIGR